MSLALVRVDDRLIHGQVVVGWGQCLKPDRIVLADDAVAGEEWERDLYRSCVPDSLHVEFASISDAARRIAAWSVSPEQVIVLVGDIESLVRLCELAPEIRRINLGGVHEGDGRFQKLPYLFLSDEEARQLVALTDRGVEVLAQDLPNATAVPVQDLL